LKDSARSSIGEKFVFAGESPYDLELQTYDMSYFRINHGFVPMGRYIDPFAPMSVAVIGYNDRQMINACLLYRFSMSYEPRDFHGELDEMPVSLVYGRAVDDLRRRYKEWIWDAEFRDTLGAQGDCRRRAAEHLLSFPPQGRVACGSSGQYERYRFDHLRGFSRPIEDAGFEVGLARAARTKALAGQAGTGSGSGRGCSGRLTPKFTTSVRWQVLP
jgi:hypothetical protein